MRSNLAHPWRCPDCGSDLVNGQGLLACPDCDRSITGNERPPR